MAQRNLLPVLALGGAAAYFLTKGKKKESKGTDHPFIEHPDAAHYAFEPEGDKWIGSKSPTSIKAKVGDKIVISMFDNPSTGYMAMSPQADLLEEHFTQIESVVGGGDDAVGSGRTIYSLSEAIKPGKFTATFLVVPPGAQSEADAVESHSIDFEITE